MIHYSIHYSRRRSISIIITPDKNVIVRVPYFTSKKSIDHFVSSKQEWIIKHLNSQNNRISLNTLNNYTNGGKIFFLGKEYTLSIVQSSSKRSNVIIRDNNIIVSSKQEGEEEIIKTIAKWYSLQASVFFTNKMKEITSQFPSFDFKPTELHVRFMKSRWGSCSRSGKIVLNTHLMKIDEKYTCYVIKHELCHLKEMNHGQGFYKILEQLSPDYKTIKKEMKNFRLQ